jgi:beta-lactamase regulating signal transducer with metallopeptidase domain
MANWSQSHLLQSLGWATLNSLWQMALLWCLYAGANALFRFSSARKYQLSVGALTTGFAWFLVTFLYYFRSSPVSSIAFFNQEISESNSLFNILLFAASVSYLALLAFPSYRLYRNWAFVQKIRHHGLHKSDMSFRLFVQKVAGQMGIRKKVLVYLSDLVNSPVTIGYFKPIILLPVAALNHLSTQQVEAILLHELSHIRRSDYLVNFLISIISTFLYFNPFVKQFMKDIEQEREHCCDELVLQYGYEKVGYASALLTLEKLSARQRALALGATGTYYLLSRIEKIVGMEKKKGFKRNQLAAILAALFCIVLFNSILIIREKKKGSEAYAFAYNDLNTPFNSFDNGRGDTHSIAPVPARSNTLIASKQSNTGTTTQQDIEKTPLELQQITEEATSPAFIQAALDEADASLTKEQKEKVASTINATRKIVGSVQWKEVNKAIADVMTEREKVTARRQYLSAMEKMVNWKNVENNMKAKYGQLDWEKINLNVDNALASIRLDSLQKSYTEALVELEKANTDIASKSRVKATPMPDQSVEEMQRSTEVLRGKIDTIKAIRNPKKVVRL